MQSNQSITDHAVLWLDGRALADRMREEMRPHVDAFTTAHGRSPRLAIVLVGNAPASEVYVRNKLRSGTAVGFRTDLERLPATASLAEAIALVTRLNTDPDIDGILVQSPLPPTMGRGAEQRVFDAIAPEKDVDGLTAVNIGRLAQNRATLVACTPAGVMRLLAWSGIAVAGRHAVVIGRSDIVGKPMSLLLLHADATVTICHSRTPDLEATCRHADIVVSAVGRPGLVTPAFVKRGAIVIDVGINTVTDDSTMQSLFPREHPRYDLFRSKGSVLVGDVHPTVADVAGALTPVPGGIGPLTISMLMHNTLTAARTRAEERGTA